jgi:DNA-binding PadR family transcriptional regulator
LTAVARLGYYIARRYIRHRYMPPTHVEFHVLLALLGGPRHGYGIMQDIDSLTSGKVKLGPGTLYSIIKRFLRAGVIEECEPDGDRRRCYRLARKGRRLATDEAERLSTLVRFARQRRLLSTP